MSEKSLVCAGTLLAAMPDLMDPNFMHTVVLLCQHSEDGAYGLVINQRTKFTIADLLPDHPLLGESDFPVHLGGPVDHGTMQFVHCVPDAIPGGLCLDGTLWLGGDLEAMGRYATSCSQEALSSLRVFLGYSGWGGGQLEAELELGSWLLVPALHPAVFGEEGESTWRRVVRSAGPDGEGLEKLPPDVSWN